MALETKTEKIGRFNYKCTQLGARESGRVFFRLMHLLAPVFDGLDVKNAASLENAIFAGVSKALASAKYEDFEALCDTFAKHSEVEISTDKWPRVADVFEVHFAGAFEEQIQWLIFCVKTNYANFLDVVTAKLKENPTAGKTG